MDSDELDKLIRQEFLAEAEEIEEGQTSKSLIGRPANTSKIEIFKDEDMTQKARYLPDVQEQLDAAESQFREYEGRTRATFESTPENPKFPYQGGPATIVPICPTCNGQGKIQAHECHGCSGSGWVWKGKEKVQCSVCGGMTIIPESTCPVCAGKGILVSEDVLSRGELYPRDGRILEIIEGYTQREIQKAQAQGQPIDGFEAMTRVMANKWGQSLYSLFQEGTKPEPRKVSKDNTMSASARVALLETQGVPHADAVAAIQTELKRDTEIARIEIRQLKEKSKIEKRDANVNLLISEAQKMAKSKNIGFAEAVGRLIEEDDRWGEVYKADKKSIAEGE